MKLQRRPYLRWVGWTWLVTFVLTTLVRYAAQHGWRAVLSLANTLGPGRAAAHPEAILRQVGAVANVSRKSPMLLITNWGHALGTGRAWPTTRLMTVAIDTSDGSRTLFEASSGVSLVGAVAASTCLPGLLAPVRLLGRRYMDGGVISPTNADVATGYGEIWIISPSAGESLDREVVQLRASGARVRVVRPSVASQNVLPSGYGSLDPTRRLAAARAGYEDGRAAAARGPAGLEPRPRVDHGWPQVPTPGPD